MIEKKPTLHIVGGEHSPPIAPPAPKDLRLVITDLADGCECYTKQIASMANLAQLAIDSENWETYRDDIRQALISIHEHATKLNETVRADTAALQRA